VFVSRKIGLRATLLRAGPNYVRHFGFRRHSLAPP
jgi:hypothetical protein